MKSANKKPIKGFTLSAGFTLVEVLIALVILAIALMAIGVAMHDSISDTIRVRQKIMAHWVASNELGSMQVGLMAPPALGQPISGTTTLLGTNWHWRSGVERRGNKYYQSVYVDVYPPASNSRVEHLVGFIWLVKSNEKKA